jgi:hypothetical protein
VVDLLLTYFFLFLPISRRLLFTFPMKNKIEKSSSQEAIGVGPIDWPNGRRDETTSMEDGRKLEGKRWIDPF